MCSAVSNHEILTVQKIGYSVPQIFVGIFLTYCKHDVTKLLEHIRIRVYLPQFK